MKKFSFFFLLFFVAKLSAQSLMFLNDSPFKLDAVIINALGKVLGELTVEPQQQVTWYAPPTQNWSGPPQAPYTVVWYCQDGAQYGIWPNATGGSMITAQNSIGQKICKFKKPKNSDSNTNTND